MEVKATIKPGQNGTKRYTRQYGDQLVCVRYRYDKRRQKRLTTVELIVYEQDWIQGITIPPDKIVPIRIAYGETELREKVKVAGAYWDSKKKFWKLSFRLVYALGLEKRIIDEFDHLE